MRHAVPAVEVGAVEDGGESLWRFGLVGGDGEGEPGQ